MAVRLFPHRQNLRACVSVGAIFDGARHVCVDRKKHVTRNDVARDDNAIASDFRIKSLRFRAPVMVRRFGQMLWEHPRPLCLSSPRISTEAANRCSYNRFAVGVRT